MTSASTSVGASAGRHVLDGVEDRVNREEPAASPRSSESSDGASLLEFDIHEDPSSEDPTRHPLTFVHCLALVIGLQIGSGIFAASSQVSKHVQSPGEAILIWIFGGLLVWTGASCIIELGCSVPVNGGIQEYLRTSYNEFAGFLFSWIWLFTTKPSSMAAVSMIFANHVTRALLPEALRPLVVRQLVALSAIWLVAYFNSLASKTSANIVKWFMFLKFAALGSIIVFGFLAGFSDHSSEMKTSKYWIEGPGYPDLFHPTTWGVVGEIVTALFGALYCYGGWETVGFVSGEMQNPARDLPRVIHSSMSIVIVGFVLMNCALYLSLPLDVIRQSEAVTVTFGERVFGAPGSVVYGIVVAISSLGSLNSNTFSTARLCEMASKRHYIAGAFGNTQYDSAEEEYMDLSLWFEQNPRLYGPACEWIARHTAYSRYKRGMPVYAIILLAAVSSFNVLIRTFDGLIVFVGIAEYLIFFFVVLGIFRIRRKLSAEKQPYKTWNSSIIIFAGISAFLVIRGVLSDPVQGLSLVINGGIAAFFYHRYFGQIA